VSTPSNPNAERAILGAILLDNSALNEAVEHLKVEDFSLDSHRRIYARMLDLAKSSRSIDTITLVAELDRHKELETVGRVGYVSALLDGVPDRPSIRHYVKIVRDVANRRLAAKKIESLQRAVTDPSVPTSALGELGGALAHAECCWLWFRQWTPSPACRRHSAPQSQSLPCARPYRYT
jgi:replicative DNA helicase